MQATINSVVGATTKTGKPYQTVVYNNDQKASSWEDDFNVYVGKTIDVEVVDNKGFKNIKLLVPTSMVAASKTQQKSQSDQSVQLSDTDIRKSSLLLALEVIKVTGKTLTTESLTAETKWVESYLRSGFEENK